MGERKKRHFWGTEKELEAALKLRDVLESLSDLRQNVINWKAQIDFDDWEMECALSCNRTNEEIAQRKAKRIEDCAKCQEAVDTYNAELKEQLLKAFMI